MSTRSFFARIRESLKAIFVLSSPCPECGGKFPGIGISHEKDSVFSYGIPVCRSCGGLGVIVRHPEFPAGIARISDLRTAFCSFAPEYPDPPFGKRLVELRRLLAAIKEFQEKFDRHAGECFARRVAEGKLDEMLEQLTALRDLELAKLRKGLEDKSVSSEVTQAAYLALVNGDYAEAQTQYERAMAEAPDSSNAAHDYACFVLLYLRDPERAMPLFKCAVERLPAKATYCLNAAECARVLGNEAEIRFYFSAAAACTDFQNLPEQKRQIVLRAVNENPDILQ